MDLVTLSIERFALKLVSESHLKWETFLPNLGMLLVLELFAMYATDGQKQRLLPLRPSLRRRGHNNLGEVIQDHSEWHHSMDRVRQPRRL